MTNPYFLGIDLGTSALKAVLYSHDGIEAASASVSYSIEYPAPGYAEQDPELWFDAAVKAISIITQKLNGSNLCSASDIVGIGVSGQMHGGVFLGKDSSPLRPAILWCDRRTTAECDIIHGVIGKERLAKITGNYALPSFTAGKLLWVRQNEPEVYSMAKSILLPKDYLRFRMTGQMNSEISDASGTNLLDIESGSWSRDIADALEIDISLLPPICESSEIVGYITPEFAALTGLKAGTPVVGGASDNAAAAVGLGRVSDGDIMMTIGTSGVISAQSDTALNASEYGINLFRSAVSGKYLILASTLSAAHCFKWFSDGFIKEAFLLGKHDEKSLYSYLEELAANVAPGCGGLTFLPHLNGGRSNCFDMNASGVFFGLTAAHGKGEMLRAVMEGVVFSLRQYFELMRELGVASSCAYVCGGGMNSKLWRQMFADNFGVKLISYNASNGPALGAAVLSSVGVGYYHDIAASCTAMLNGNTSVTYPENASVYDDAYRQYKMLYPALKNVFRSQNQI